MELRHDCSGPEQQPTFRRELWTSLVFRLKQPFTSSCKNKLNGTFVWRFGLTQSDRCRGMLGCHYSDEKASVLSLQDIVYQVTAKMIPGSGKKKRRRRLSGRKRQADDENLIKMRRNRYFWDLAKGDELEMRIKYTSTQAASMDYPITCFAWCNKNMDDTAPLREENFISAIIAPQLINNLVSNTTISKKLRNPTFQSRYL